MRKLIKLLSVGALLIVGTSTYAQNPQGMTPKLWCKRWC